MNAQTQRLLNLIARRLHLMPQWAKVQELKQTGVFNECAKWRDRRRYLPLIAEAKPIECGSGEVEVHMLLHHGSILEGLWGLYSFAHFAGIRCNIIVHNDGSLLPSDKELLNRIFPGCQIIERELADLALGAYFAEHNLKLCAELRNRFILTLKLFDVAYFAQKEPFIVLDSDVLFFSRPGALLEGEPKFRYMQDARNAYSLRLADLDEITGGTCFRQCNAGVLSVSKLPFETIEKHLAHPKLVGKVYNHDWYLEQTLYALSLTAAGACALPVGYRIAPRDVWDADLICGHYCGGPQVDTLYYTQAIPQLAREMLGVGAKRAVKAGIAKRKPSFL